MNPPVSSPFWVSATLNQQKGDRFRLVPNFEHITSVVYTASFGINFCIFESNQNPTYMKRKLLFSLFGAVIIFAWQFISFAMPNFHNSAARYTPAQDSILQIIEKQGLKEGMYFLGQPDPSLSQAEQQAYLEKLEGKPWAVINYHETNKMSMAMNMIRGFLVCFVISFLLFWLFLQQKNPTLTNRLLLSLSVGIIGFFFVPYTLFIWYKAPDIFAHFADAIVPWVILGFLGHKMTSLQQDDFVENGETAP